ncbi:MAG TPA: 3-deoxy-manno-octulosonate cytidylyltransferase [Candidatus Kapabacteria bacterium]|nr:3-deoxy-manno-octulosonate cytidylyltransferase [Candidatus Kapabacteria bacterium]
MKTAIIIPSRLGSTRLERKPLRHIAGVSLVERVYHGCEKAHNIDFLAVATDSEEIAEHVRSFGGNVIMTPTECSTGTERVGVAARSLPDDIDVIINVQGDEPLIDPVVIDKLRNLFEMSPGVRIVTPISPLADKIELQNPGTVKVALTRDHRALYFSRLPIPFDRDGNDRVQYWQHIGVYGFRKKNLLQILELPLCPLEEAEKLEQLRWLDAGYEIHCVEVNYHSVAVDTEDDVQKVEAILRKRGEA